MEFLEIPLFDDDVYKLLVRFAINIFFLSLIVAFAIYPGQRKREFAFTAVMMNVTVFFICFTLKKLELDIGMALGLFAIFGVLRYRTDAIRVKEMTYLFIVIGIAVINSLSNKKTSYAEIALVNSLIFAVAMLKERMIEKTQETRKQKRSDRKREAEAGLDKYAMDYDRLDLLNPEQRNLLLADLRERTGLNVQKVQIRNVSLSQNTAKLTVWCGAVGNAESDGTGDGPQSSDESSPGD